ncbi:phosphoenolpyruvate--protein phosphotransferase [Maridesulfovibrio hydrothermalis]|uniref:Phosphoenolpyruvate-protein phosphotransferase n=1 Tax=Maridesulfovibrio hydrothermalis AM13 = DSM 14728 TaxID=1121451 RepID=L0RFB9_9BACT|nr:phosphoenolpyruvate--protein phosphotransferase [Maridesulfovibrio hydrothermalis]CCO24897.1 Phosphoenolpyruvate-protein phosphotransferase [Maridesulfovibrio hydrothermalis AM13 = DSM 14728]
MVGLVIVSHSQTLAQGVLELAEQMTRGSVVMEAAGGIDDPDNPIGTDPMKVMMAIESVAAQSEEGVLVIMDLGSALMSAETALDFLPDEVKKKVLLCSAPIVEGTMAAAVQASVGASLKEVSAEAGAALNVKIEQLAPITGESVQTSGPAQEEVLEGENISIDLPIMNKMGLHARPAANIVAEAGKFKSTIQIRKDDKTASAKSINQVALLAVKNGETITVTATGPDAQLAIDSLKALHANNFGERDEDVTEVVMKTKPCKIGGEGVVSGAPASTGYAVGPVYAHLATLPEVKRTEISDTAAEVARLDQALAAALSDIQTLQRETEKTAGKANAAIFEVHGLILGDKDMRDKAVSVISDEKINAEFAWLQVMNKMASDYRELDDSYMQARAADVMDCGGRVLRVLTGEDEQAIKLEHESIIVAHDLTPSDVAGMDPEKVLGIVTEIGGTTSHAAILSRSMGIPAVIGTGECFQQISSGQIIALDGFEGMVWTSPDQAKLDEISTRRNKWLAECEEAKAKGAAPAKTKDGTEIMVMGNIGNPSDAHRVAEYGAEGAGLFRTEFLFQDRDQEPDENEQFESYVEAAKAMNGNPVIIRTLDIGGDKPVKYLDTPVEDNPFLGERGVRFCMARPELFRTQLRALLRAASEENIWIMFPMISGVEELNNVLAFQDEVRKGLMAEGIKIIDKVKTGIMIEVPSAVAEAEKLGAICDFFSIGTNDLTQYVMAADRGNKAVAEICDSLNPAVLRMIKMTCDAAKTTGIEVGMCGELAGNSKASALLLGLGLNELSMSGPSIPEVKEAIRAVSMNDCHALAEKALAANSGDEVRELL